MLSSLERATSSTVSQAKSQGTAHASLFDSNSSFTFRVFIHRATIHPILLRLGIDMLSTRIIHLRDDDRFKAVGPDTFVQTSATSGPVAPGAKTNEEGEIWFDWAFIDFWKSNYCEFSNLPSRFPLAPPSCIC